MATDVQSALDYANGYGGSSNSSAGSGSTGAGGRVLPRTSRIPGQGGGGGTAKPASAKAETYGEYKSDTPDAVQRSNTKYIWDQAADEDVTNGIGANGRYTEKAGDFVRDNPFASPDYYMNWINGGNPSDFANYHTAPTTNQWARYGDAFNNHRWWNPGTAGELGTIGGSGSTSGTIGEVGHGERWEPIDTQELRAQKRREDYESQVRGLGMQRQDTYARYPYEMNKRQQEMQMDTNYAINRHRAEAEIDYGMLQQKCDDLVKGTGVYAQALWALCGVGGFHLNDWDRQTMIDLQHTIEDGKKRGKSRDAIMKECENIFRQEAERKARIWGISVQEAYKYVRQYMTSGQFGSMIGGMRDSASMIMGGTGY